MLAKNTTLLTQQRAGAIQKIISFCEKHSIVLLTAPPSMIILSLHGTWRRNATILYLMTSVKPNRRCRALFSCRKISTGDKAHI